jgi:hypothetical protein
LETALPGIVGIEKQTIGGNVLTLIRRTENRVGLVFQDANFEATNVRNEKDADDLLSMVKTYRSDRWTAPAVR